MSVVSEIKRLGNQLWPQRFHPYTLAEAKVRSAANGRVLAGPFAGMRLAQTSICSAFLPKMLGTYERELTEWIEALCEANFGTIINVGAADGFFAVGMALRCQKTRVHAFEMEPEGRELLQQMAAANQVSDRVEIRGLCTSEALAALLSRHPGALVIMDVEGAEDGLLVPELVPALADCRILVELHEAAVPGIGKKIATRFEATHTIREVRSQERSLEDLPIRSALLDRWLLKLTREFRSTQMSWYDLAPKTGGTFDIIATSP